MATINRISIVVRSNGNSNAVSDLKVEVYINGNSKPSDFTNEGIDVYRYHDGFKHNFLESEQKLPNNYILNENEEYYVNIKELKVGNQTYDGGIWQSGGFTFINGVDISELKDFGMSSKYDNQKSESFGFVYTHKEVEVQTQEEVTTIGATDTEPSEVVSQPTEVISTPSDNVTVEKSFDTNYFLYGIICGLLVVVIIMAISIGKLKKDK